MSILLMHYIKSGLLQKKKPLDKGRIIQVYPTKEMNVVLYESYESLMENELIFEAHLVGFRTCFKTEQVSFASRCVSVHLENICPELFENQKTNSNNILGFNTSQRLIKESSQIL